MYLFILESLGTQELILIGIIALVVFGPRKLPEMARKLGSMMSDFRRVSSDFRSTWENAVSIEDEVAKPKKINGINSDDSFEIKNTNGTNTSEIEKRDSNGNAVLPEVRKVSKEEFDDLISNKVKKVEPTKSDKTDWL